MKKRIEIRELLRWVYRQELPKAGSGGCIADVRPMWLSIERYGELLTRVDQQYNAFGLAPDLTATTGPHPDAVRVADAVAGLNDYAFTVPDDWDPLEDFPGLGDVGAAAARRAIATMTVDGGDGRVLLRRPISQLVMFRAIMGGMPEWQWEGAAPAVKPVRFDNGTVRWFRMKEIPMPGGKSYAMEDDGFDPRRRVPYPDAYQKYVLEPDPHELIIGRAEYELWLFALGALVDSLGDGLDMWSITPCPLPARPWVEAIPAKRILRSVRGWA